MAEASDREPATETPEATIDVGVTVKYPPGVDPDRMIEAVQAEFDPERKLTDLQPTVNVHFSGSGSKGSPVQMLFKLRFPETKGLPLIPVDEIRNKLKNALSSFTVNEVTLG